MGKALGYNHILVMLLGGGHGRRISLHVHYIYSIHMQYRPGRCGVGGAIGCTIPTS